MAGSTYIDVDAAIEAAKQALKERSNAMAKVGIVRTDLRNAVTMGAATPEQRKWIEEQFPVRERKRKSKADVSPINKAA